MQPDLNALPPQCGVRSPGPACLVCLACGVVSGLCVLLGCTPIRLWFGFPNTPLTTLLFLAAAATAKTAAPSCYRWRMVAGLGWSALGDALLMQGKNLFVAGLASFLVAHLFYVWAFLSDSRLGGRKLPFIVWGAWGVVLVAWLWPAVASGLRPPVVLYAVALVIMASQAASRAITHRNLAATLAAVGGGFFVMSDSFLALRRFNHILESSHVQVLGTYFIAQAGLCLSVAWFGNGSTAKQESKSPLHRSQRDPSGRVAEPGIDAE